jgi:hypothetical protein
MFLYLCLCHNYFHAVKSAVENTWYRIFPSVVFSVVL